jgi:hypothetical protein
MKLDFLFRQHTPRSGWRNRKDPLLDPHSAASESPLSDDSLTKIALPPPRLGVGVRQMSPRQLVEWAHEMYLSGALNWQEYRFAGFHAELHPDYNTTVGALIGQMAAPDRPRDMIREWEDRLAFYCRHNTPQDPQVRKVEKVLALLCSPISNIPNKERRSN